jgi:hypothetical protein
MTEQGSESGKKARKARKASMFRVVPVDVLEKYSIGSPANVREGRKLIEGVSIVGAEAAANRGQWAVVCIRDAREVETKTVTTSKPVKL